MRQSLSVPRKSSPHPDLYKFYPDPARHCDLPKNLLGAKAMGIHPVQIRVNPNAEPCPEGIPSIDKISDILELLD